MTWLDLVHSRLWCARYAISLRPSYIQYQFPTQTARMLRHSFWRGFGFKSSWTFISRSRSRSRWVRFTQQFDRWLATAQLGSDRAEWRAFVPGLVSGRNEGELPCHCKRSGTKFSFECIGTFFESFIYLSLNSSCIIRRRRCAERRCSGRRMEHLLTLRGRFAYNALHACMNFRILDRLLRETKRLIDDVVDEIHFNWRRKHP